MTLTELRYIVALAHTRHFGRAAEQCHVSQPTLSVAVKKLEDRLGVALFERSRSAVRVTPVGQQIIQQAERVLEETRTLEALARAGQDPLAAPLRLGAIYTIGPYLFPRLVPALRKAAPQMPLYLEENFTEVLRGRLRNGDLDAILIALPFEEPDVLVRALADEAFVLLLPPDHPWQGEASIDPAELKTTRLLMLGEGHCFRDQVLESCPGITSVQSGNALVTEGSSLETLRLMVASGLGATVVPVSAIRHLPVDAGVQVKPFRNPPPQRTLALAWRASFPRPQAIEVVLRALSECTENLDGMHG